MIKDIYLLPTRVQRFFSQLVRLFLYPSTTSTSTSVPARMSTDMSWDIFCCICSSCFLACIVRQSNAGQAQCESLLEYENTSFRLSCEAKYSRSLKLHYRDRRIRADTPYRVWVRGDPRRHIELLITLHKTPLWDCGSVRCSSNWLHCHCQHSYGTGIAIRPDSIFCYKFNFSYVGELQSECGMKPLRVDFVAIHYGAWYRDAGRSSSSGAGRLKWALWSA
ncbi:uncharacterized protein LOC108153768 [Drosophila miranda]|uniref:uncharacterized protein LOC108153768 n=1 Tax=Drosophila miranda TaxID=7229 RepID=UPI0007E5FF10|nr:uncharacterized protein LOC108153768 [Drosophila miranda]